MITKNFLEIIGKIDGNISDYYWGNIPEKEIILNKTIKLSEEVWELSWEVLATFWNQRKEKMKNKKKGDLGDEFADVILCTLLLAKWMNVDINLALEKKLEKIKERWLL